MINIDQCMQRITAGDAIPISLVGMAIVFVSLLFISIFIGALPHVLKLLGLMKEDEEGASQAKSAIPDDNVIAAIGAVMRYRMQGDK